MPERDWAEDWVFDEEWRKRLFEISKQSSCPVLSSKEKDVHVLLDNQEAIRVFKDEQTFSSRYPTFVSPRKHTALRIFPPLTTDPPRQAGERRLIAPYFFPNRIKSRLPKIREICESQAARLRGLSAFDASFGYVYPIQAAVIEMFLNVSGLHDAFLRMLGRDSEGNRVSEPDSIKGTFGPLVKVEISKRKDRPGDYDPEDDIILGLLEKSKNESFVYGAMLFMMSNFGGSWSVSNNIMVYLSQNPDDVAYLTEDLSRLHKAKEELIRLGASLMLTRTANKDVVVAGCPVRKGEHVLLPTHIINRDPKVYSSPDKADFSRTPVHSTFGVGTHRCPTATLMRTMIEELLRAFLAEVPRFRLTEEIIPINSVNLRPLYVRIARN